MFVRLKQGSKVTTYDCRRVSWEPRKIEEDKTLTKARVILDVGEQSERCFEFECTEGNEFILMNDQGKTVDRQVW
jgi:hypothetical protein